MFEDRVPSQCRPASKPGRSLAETDAARLLRAFRALSKLTRDPTVARADVFQEACELLGRCSGGAGGAACRIIFDEQEYCAAGFRASDDQIVSSIMCEGQLYGRVELHYDAAQPPGLEIRTADRMLLDEVAARLALAATRSQADELLRATNGFLASVMESVTHAIYVLDLEGHFSLVSRASSPVFGYDPEELIDRPFAVLFEEADYNVLHQRFIAAKVLGERTCHHEIEISRRDGSRVAAAVSLSPLYEDGELVGVVGTAEDVTERRRLIGQLLRAQRLESVGSLAAGLAHEINTPAQYVGDNTRFLEESFAGLSNLLQDYGRLVDALHEGAPTDALLQSIRAHPGHQDRDYLCSEIPAALRQMHEGIGKVTEIVQALQEFTRPAAREKAALDLNRIVVNTLTVARPRWEPVAEIALDLDARIPMLLGYPHEINQVVLNLLINAAEAVARHYPGRDDRPGRITIRTVAAPEHVLLECTDNGPGIDPETQRQMFDPFFTTKAVGDGAGQGLTIVYNAVVEKHGGQVTWANRPEGGTVFIVRLPLSETANANPVSGTGQTCPAQSQCRGF